MKLVGRIVLVVFVLGLVLFVCSRLMPSHYAVQRIAVIPAPSDTLYQRFATLRTWNRWSAWNSRRDPSIVYVYEGPETGKGGAMRWTSRKMGDGRLDLVDAEPGHEVEYQLRMQGTDFVAHGHIRLEPVAGGTKVTWRDDGDLGQNGIYRLMGPFMDKMLGSAFEQSFAGLKADTQRS